MTRLRPLAPSRPLLALGALILATGLLGSCSGGDDHAVGDAVEIDFYDDRSERVGSGTIAVTDVHEGSTSELEADGFELDPDESAATAYYVDVRFENQGDAAVPLHAPGIEDPDGGLISPLTVIDLGGDQGFGPCPGVPQELAPNDEAEGCAIVLVPADREMEKVYYHPGGAEDFIYWTTG